MTSLILKHSKKNQLKKRGNIQKINFKFCFILSGISFLFFLGFPFENHNESYTWIASFDQMDLRDLLTKRLPSTVTFRPIGVSIAYLAYLITKGLWLQQLLNWTGAIIAFYILFYSSRNKANFSILGFLITTAFFPGYIFLFHLHGVFYSPLLIYIAILLFAAPKLYTKTQFFLLFLLTVFVGFIHTFAFLVYASCLVGYFLQYCNQIKKLYIPALAQFLAVLWLAFWLGSSHIDVSAGEMFRGFLTSFRTTEINILLSVLSLGLCILSVWTVAKLKNIRIVLIPVILLLFFVLKYFHIPVLLLWITFIIIKCIIQKEWIVLSILLSTLTFPLVTLTGSPTYAIFVLLVSAFAMAAQANTYGINRFLIKHRRLPQVSILVIIMCFILIKSGVRIPLISNIVNPLLAEKEKTHQLKKIINWYKTSVYRDRYLNLFESAENPSMSKNAINRKHRAPTQQANLDYYVQYYLRKDTLTQKKKTPLLISFGNQQLNNKSRLFTIPGRYNGAAMVFE